MFHVAGRYRDHQVPKPSRRNARMHLLASLDNETFLERFWQQLRPDVNN